MGNDDTLGRFSRRLDEIEKKLHSIESSSVILDEKTVVSREKELEGKTYFSTKNGGIVKEVRVPVCDVCGRKSEEFNACVGCRRKMCETCSISYRNKVYCTFCLSKVLPLTKPEYKLLTAIANNVNLKSAADIARTKREELKECEGSLLAKGLVEKRGFLFFHETNIMDRGLEALAAYRQVYGNEEDVIIFEDMLGRSLNEKD